MPKESKTNSLTMGDLVTARRANAINLGSYPVITSYSDVIRRIKVVHPARLSPTERLKRFVELAAK